ncbi:hypothetical protein [Pannonibacter carbonis]|uniref:hypothetical protein n=1 Tax=Pannonibacter carbonis TaxID=2067569 RepID=UPI000D0F563A|nr:hypothetical protein [Pannonibacter carbonis]
MEETGVQDGTRPAATVHGSRAAEVISGGGLRRYRQGESHARPAGRDIAERDTDAAAADEESPSTATGTGAEQAPKADLVRLALHKILTSPEFASADQLRAFLRYVVEAAVGAQGQEPAQAVTLKGYTIATEALGRGADFNPTTDPIVRVEAARLRKRLQDYYAGTGRDDPIRIDIPKGSYAPQFVLPKSQQPVEDLPAEQTQDAAPGIRGPVWRGEEPVPFRPLVMPSAVPGAGRTQATTDRSRPMTLVRLLAERPDLVGVVALVFFTAGLVIGRI